MNFLSVEILSAAMFFTSFYGLVVSRNIIKSIICIGFMEMAVIMFLISIGFTDGMRAPIIENVEGALQTEYADPLPQALLLTAIIIGITVTAVNITFFISLCRQYKATFWDIVKKKNTE
jgi:multicomponent Na+:H+ antiporter subunit C